MPTLTGAEVVARARSMIGRGCAYAVGAGGRTAAQLEPWDPKPFTVKRADPKTGGILTITVEKACDCSGFGAWGNRIARHLDPEIVPHYAQDNGEWFESSALARDANSPWGFVNRVSWAEARPGMLFVYPDQVVDGVRHQGHVAIVSEIETRPGEVVAPAMIVHCSAGNYRRTGDAIRETKAAIFFARRDAIVCALSFVDYEGAA